MRKKLRLWVWEGVLYDYTSGIAFALAYTAEEAVEQVKAAGLNYPDKWDGIKLDGVEPVPYGEPIGFYLFGGN